jgi:regulator of protease activity HflC (stomatin/prohibitin superfamily)
MFGTILLLILVLAFAGGLAAAFLSTNSDTASIGKLIALGAGVFGAIVFVTSSLSSVPTRNVGIVTQFNKPTGRTTGAGLQWHAPWQSVDDWDASGQTFAHLGDGCVWLTIKAQRRACVPVQVEWNAKPENAPENWAAYREVDGKSRFEVWTDRRVNPQINGALTSLFADFDPLGTVDPKSGDAPAPDLNKLYRDKLMDELNRVLGNDVNVRSVAFEAPRYDEPTTKAIEAYGQKVLEKRNLEIDKENADTRRAIAGQSGMTPFEQQCLDIASKNGGEPGLCRGGGADAGVIVDTRK